jgi:hypothetical protein
MYFSNVEEGGVHILQILIFVSNLKGEEYRYFHPILCSFTEQILPYRTIKYAGIAWIHFDGPTKYISIKM